MLEPTNLYVKLPGDVAHALIETSRREWRHPKEQAALYIAEGLRRAGTLPTDDHLTAAGSPAMREPA
jgi:hypothetical protein